MTALSRCRFSRRELGCILDRRADQSPPHFKSGLALCVARRLELGIPKKDGVERGQDLGAAFLRPSDRVRVLERPVLGVGAINVEADGQAARRQVAAWANIVAGE